MSDAKEFAVTAASAMVVTGAFLLSGMILGWAWSVRPLSRSAVPQVPDCAVSGNCTLSTLGGTAGEWQDADARH